MYVCMYIYIYVYRWPLFFGTYRLKSLQAILQLNEGTSLLVGESITTYVTPRNHSWAWNHTKEIHYIFWCLREEGLSDCRQNPGVKTFEQLIDSTGSIWEIPINRETTIVYGSKFAALHFTLWSYMNWLGIITRKGGYLLTKPYLLGWGLRVFFRWKIPNFWSRFAMSITSTLAVSPWFRHKCV